jgi:tetratricopeptide (TPR) repeat protein
VRYLQELRPELQRLQDIAQEGMFPGLELGIERLMRRQPEIERVIRNISRGLGDAFESAGGDLMSSDWDDFFNYIRTQAQPLLKDMLNTMGDFINGIADVIVAFDPLTRRFSDGLAGMAQDFSDWAANLDESQGFAAFVRYIEETGPHVADMLGSMAAAMLALVEAAAPIGDVTVRILIPLFDGLAAILDSPAGPALIAIAAGLSAVSRAIALFQVANGSALLTFMRDLGHGGVSDRAAAGLERVSKSTTAITSQAPSLRQLGTAMAFSAYSTDTLTTSLNSGSKAARESAASALAARHAVRGFGTTVGDLGKRVGGPVGQVGLLAVSLSDLDDNLGLTNTTMLTLMGSMAGPWGAAAGAAIGVTMDLRAAQEDAREAVDQATAAIESQSRAMQEAARSNILREMAELSEGGVLQSWTNFADLDWGKVFSGDLGGLGNVRNGLGETTQASDELEEALRDLDKAMMRGEPYEVAQRKIRQTEEALSDFRASFRRTEDLLTNKGTAVAYERAFDDIAKRVRNRFDANDFFDIDKERGRRDFEALNGFIDSAITRADKLRESGHKLAAERMLTEALRDLEDLEIKAPRAQGFIDRVRNELVRLDQQHSSAQITVKNDQAVNAMDEVARGLRAVDGSVATAYINVLTRRTREGGGFGIDPGEVPGLAGGGTVRGRRYPYRDKVLVGLAPTEEVVSNSRGQADLFREELKAINNYGLAMGGTVAELRDRVWQRIDDDRRARASSHGQRGVSVSVTGPDYDQIAAVAARHTRAVAEVVNVSGDPTMYNRQMLNLQQQASVGQVPI